MRTRDELTPVVAAAQGLCAPEVVNSLLFRKEAFGRLDFGGVNPELLMFKRAFERALHEAGFPFYALKIEPERVRFVRFPRGAGASAEEWLIVSTLGLEVARRLDLDVIWRAADPTWWALGW